MCLVDKNHPEIILPKKNEETKEVINIELDTLTGMIKNPYCDFRDLINQVYKVMMVLHRLGSRENKVYALDKELQMQVEVQNVKKTYNGWASLTITIISGGLTILGGATGIFGVIPGTMVGEKIAGAFPKALGFFSNALTGKKISEIGQAIGTVGQGTGVFSKIFDNRAEAERAVLQFALETSRRRHEGSSSASREETQQTREAIRNAQQGDAAAHEAISSMLRSTQS